MPTKTERTSLALIALLGLGVVLLTLSALFFVDFESPLLGDELLRRANEASGMNLSARGFRLNFSKGAELRGVEARSRMPGVRYDIDLESLRFRHEPFELLKGRLYIERAVAESPRISLRIGSDAGSRAPATSPTRPVAPKPGSLPPEAEEEPNGGGSEPFFDIALDVSELDIRNGAFLVQQSADDVVRLLIEGVDWSLGGLEFDRNAVTLLHGVTANGRIAIRELRFATTVVEDVAARIDLERGRLELDELALENEERRWTGRLSLDANSIPFRYELALRGGPFDALPFARSMDFSFEGRGFGVDSKNLTGAGAATLAGGTLPDSSWVRALEARSERSPLVGASYETSRLTFRLENDHLYFEPFTLRLAEPNADLTVAGTASLDGELALDVTLDDVLYLLRGNADAPRVTVAR